MLREKPQFRIDGSGIVEGDALEVTCLDDSALRREVALDVDKYDPVEVVERVRFSFKPCLATPEGRNDNA